MVVGFAPSPARFPLVVNENLGSDPRTPADIQFGPPAPIRIDRAYDKRLSSDECSSPARRTTGTTTGVMTPDYFHDPAK